MGISGIGYAGSLSYIGHDAAGGGGPDSYQAQAVVMSDVTIEFWNGTLVVMDTPPDDSPYGFMSLFLKRPTNSGFILFNNGNCTFNLGGNGDVHIELADYDYNNYLAINAPVSTIPGDAWCHFLFAWDTNHAAGSRRVSLYVDDTRVSTTFGDDGEVAFPVGYQDLRPSRLLGKTADEVLSVADYGLWVGTNIVEADSTISEINRRKFVSASGKPVNPSNWPSNPVGKLSGDAAAFQINQGSAGAVRLGLDGTLTDAEDSPSD